MIKIKFIDSNNFYDVSFRRENDNIVTLSGEFPVSNAGFLTYRLNGETQLGDFSDYITVYRTLEDGSIQYSNDGTVWTEPTVNIVVSINWDDENDREECRPESVDVTVDGEVVTLNEENGWQEAYMELPSGTTMDVVFNEIENYTLSTSGTSATYRHECIPLPTLEERIEVLEEAVCEIADAII